jgi:hypothetical protein
MVSERVEPVGSIISLSNCKRVLVLSLPYFFFLRRRSWLGHIFSWQVANYGTPSRPGNRPNTALILLALHPQPLQATARSPVQAIRSTLVGSWVANHQVKRNRYKKETRNQPAVVARGCKKSQQWQEKKRKMDGMIYILTTLLFIAVTLRRKQIRADCISTNYYDCFLSIFILWRSGQRIRHVNLLLCKRNADTERPCLVNPLHKWIRGD